jgi:hypothetical protein
MLNNNAFKTSLIFLAIILFTLTLRMFLLGDEAIVMSQFGDGIANTFCIIQSNC